MSASQTDKYLRAKLCCQITKWKSTPKSKKISGLFEKKNKKKTIESNESKFHLP